MRTLKVFVVVLLSMAALTAMGQNVLVNGDFETNPPSAFGNNIGYSIAPWVLGSGQTSNVVKVDGPGGYNYGNNGPESDASALGAGVAQHYLDIANGENTFYQTFTPRCSGQVTFGGSFSTRADSTGTARVEIHQGANGVSGPLIGASNTVQPPAGNSATTPWTSVSYTALLSSSQTYSFVVFMDNNLNFDNGFVTFEDCPPPNPCCPPWNRAALADMMVYHGTGGIAAPYTLEFQPSATLQSQMQTYINFLHTMNMAISQITIEFRLHDGGTGTVPVMLAQLGTSHYITWQEGLTTGGFPTPTFFSGTAETMIVNRWYVIHTGIYLENNQTWFGPECANNDIGVRIQVLPLSRKGDEPAALLQIRDGSGHITEKRIQLDR